MDFEYGCSTTNKFCFLDENEVEDPSELLAHATKEATSAKDAKTGKDAKAKPKSADAKGKAAAGKDAKKQPLQQQTDNSVKKSAGDDLKKDAKKPGQAKPPAQTPREDKENTSNRQSSGQGPRTGEQRRPKPEGQTGDAANRGPQDRPPRRTGPRPDRGDRPDRPDRPPRRPRPEENAEGNVAGEENVANLEGGETGFRRTGGSAGGYRGPRTGGGERRSGGFRSGPGAGGFRPRRSNDPDHPREFDRHSGSEKTGVKAVDKKEGAGKGNWGTATDELAAEGEVLNETQEQTTENQNWAERVEESEEKGEEEDKEQHPNFMTLDEYKALKNQVSKKNDFNTRRPGEGEDLSKWGKTYVLPKKPVDEEEEEEEEQEEEEEEQEENEEDEKKKQLLSQIQFKFYDSGSDRRGGDRRQGERRGPPRPRRPQAEGETGQAQQTAQQPAQQQQQPQQQQQQQQQPQGDNANPQNDNETQSPSGKPRFNRGPAGGQQRGNNQQRRGPRDAQGGQSRGNQKAPKFDDEKDFPSLGK